MENKLLEQNIKELLEGKKFADIKQVLSKINVVDLSIFLSDIPSDILPRLFRLLPKDTASEVFVQLDSAAKRGLIASFTDTELSYIVNEMFADDTVDFIEEMPANVVLRIISSASNATRTSINHLLNYPKDSAGSIMTTEFITLKENMTVQEAFGKIRRQGIDKETIYTCYVTDDTRRLIGVVTARKLMLSLPTNKISELMEDNVIYSLTTSDKEEVALKIDKYGFLALPIVDTEKRIVGIVTVDDAMDVLREESTEDISKMAAIVPTHKPYLKTSVLRLSLARLPWLLILMVTATLTGWVIRDNEAILDMPIIGIILTASIPMLMDTGGNAGSQALTTIVRSMALNEVKMKDIFKVMFKEFRVSILLGFALSIACFIKLMFIDMLFTQDRGALIAFVISVSMLFTVIISKLIGGSLPILAKKIRLDPAIVASPLITSIVDTLALLVYVNIAITLLA